MNADANGRPGRSLSRRVTALAILLMIAVGILGVNWHHLMYFDLNSGDVLHEERLAGVVLHRTVGQTGFSRALREHGDVRSPPTWVFKMDRNPLGSQTDGDVYGIWPADIDQGVDVLRWCYANGAEGDRWVKRLMADLAADHKDAFHADLNAALADPHSTSASGLVR